MTTIADFLNTYKGYTLQKTAKTAWLWGPTKSNVMAGLKGSLTPDFMREQLEAFIRENPAYKPASPFLLQDQGLLDHLSQWAPEAVFNYYETDDGGIRSKDTDWVVLQDQVNNKTYKIPEALKTKFINEAQNYVTKQWNSPNKAQYLYQIARGYMPEGERAVLDRQVARNPELANRIGRIIAARSKPYLDKGLDYVMDPTNQEELFKTLTPELYDEVLSNGLNNLDMLPDDLAVGSGMSEQAYLERNLFGDDPAFKGSLSQYYDPKNPYKSNQVVFGLLNEFQKEDSPLRLAAINHYRNLPENQRGTSMLSRWLGTMQNFANDFGQANTREQLGEARKNLSANLGTYGKTFFGNEYFDNEFGNQVGARWDAAQKALSNSNVGRQWLHNWKGFTPDEKMVAAQNAYADGIRNRRLEDSYYGIFADPGAQKAMQYAAPFMTYGAPLAAIGSAMGTNALWPLMAIGGIGAAGLRYGAETGALGIDPKTLESWDEQVGAFNSPMNVLHEMLPKGMQPSFKSLFNLKDTTSPTTKTAPESTKAPAPKPPATTTTYKSPTQMDMYAGNNLRTQPTFSATGNTKKPDRYYDPLNPMGIQNQKLEFA